MGYTYSGDAVLGVSLNVNTPKPLDIRAVVNSTVDLYSIPEQTAYVGMTVANIADGNIYMLVDKSNINNKSGWRASYESIQIIACTAEEYKQWLDNTEINGEIFTPKEESLPFIHANTYYYLYEDSGIIGENGELVKDSQNYYVTKSWIEEQLSTKANAENINTSITSINNDITDLKDRVLKLENLPESIETLSKNLSENYYDKNYIEETYYNKESINTSIDSINTDINNKLEDYVTKESLRGDSETEEDDFIFVTQSKYNQDYQITSENIGTLQTNVQNLQTSSDILSNQIEENSETLNSLPKHISISADEYEKLQTKDDNTYYYIQQPEGDYGWVTIAYLKANYQNQIDELTLQINELRQEIEKLKNPSES